MSKEMLGSANATPYGAGTDQRLDGSKAKAGAALAALMARTEKNRTRIGLHS